MRLPPVEARLVRAHDGTAAQKTDLNTLACGPLFRRRDAMSEWRRVNEQKEILRRGALSHDCIREGDESDVVCGMPKTPRSAEDTPVPFIKGQLWKYGDRCLRIEHVGRLLVEHRGVSLDKSRKLSSRQMIAMKDLQTFLKANHAVLLP